MTRAELEQVYYLKKEILLLQKELKGNGESEVYSGQLEKLYAQVSATSAEIVKYISGIKDSTIRQIVFLRCVKLKSWVSIAMVVGGNNTADSVRMMYKRFLKKEGIM